MIESDIPRAWLTKQLIFVAKTPLERTERSRKIEELASEFVNLRSDWEDVFGAIGPEDEIWEFDSPGDHWLSLCGRSGIALVRLGKPIEPFLRMAWLSEESSSSFVRANTQAYGKTEVQSEWGICSFGVS
jgi:hypothetical protein